MATIRASAAVSVGGFPKLGLDAAKRTEPGRSSRFAAAVGTTSAPALPERQVGLQAI
jgi:hypothetical protein